MLFKINTLIVMLPRALGISYFVRPAFGQKEKASVDRMKIEKWIMLVMDSKSHGLR